MACRSAASAISCGVLRLVAPLAARDDQPQIRAARLDGFFQRAAGHGRDPGAVPIETEHAAEGLEPPRVRQPPQHFRRTVFLDDRHVMAPANLLMR